MFWKRKKRRLTGTAERLENASQKERTDVADNLCVLATDLKLRRKFSEARDAASEAIKLFEGLGGHEMDIAKLHGFIAEALEGLGMHADASRMYLMAIHFAKEANPDSYHLQCRLWIGAGFAQIHAGSRVLDRQLARIAWKNAAQLCKLLERKANESISTGRFDDLLVAKFNREKVKLEEHSRRINELHEEIGSIMVKPSADEIFDIGCRCMKEENFRWAVETFTSLIDLAPDDKRGWLGRADANLALSCFLAEEYRAKGGKEYSLDRGELLAPISKPLEPPDKQRWWKTKERIVKLQYAAKIDYHKVLELDPNNQRSMEALQDLRDMGT